MPLNTSSWQPHPGWLFNTEFDFLHSEGPWNRRPESSLLKVWRHLQVKCFGQSNWGGPLFLYFLSLSSKETIMDQIKSKIRQRMESISESPFPCLTTEEEGRKQTREKLAIPLRSCLQSSTVPLARERKRTPCPDRDLVIWRSGDLHIIPIWATVPLKDQYAKHKIL